MDESLNIQKHLKESKGLLKSCLGSQCIDEAGTYTSLYAYVRVLTAQKKQAAYVMYLEGITAGETLGKSEVLMKASNEYKEYLIYFGYSEALLEQIRNFRAKGKGDDQEKMVT